MVQLLLVFGNNVACRQQQLLLISQQAKVMCNKKQHHSHCDQEIFWCRRTLQLQPMAGDINALEEFWIRPLCWLTLWTLLLGPQLSTAFLDSRIATSLVVV
jgi:hypothetical protein